MYRNLIKRQLLLILITTNVIINGELSSSILVVVNVTEDFVGGFDSSNARFATVSEFHSENTRVQSQDKKPTLEPTWPTFELDYFWIIMHSIWASFRTLPMISLVCETIHKMDASVSQLNSFCCCFNLYHLWYY